MKVLTPPIYCAGVLMFCRYRFGNFSYYFFQNAFRRFFFGLRARVLPESARRRAQVCVFSCADTLPIPRHFFSPGDAGGFNLLRLNNLCFLHILSAIFTQLQYALLSWCDAYYYWKYPPQYQSVMSCEQ